MENCKYSKGKKKVTQNIRAKTKDTNNNKNDNIKLIEFGRDGSNYNVDDTTKILNSTNNMIETIITTINCDKGKPQHHNMYCSDPKSGYVYIYEENKWCTKRNEEALEQIINYKLLDLHELMTRGGKHISRQTKKQIMDNINEVATIDNDELCPCETDSRRKLRRRILHILYNNRKMIMETKKENE